MRHNPVMRITYPPELAARALAGHEPPRLAEDGACSTAALPQVVSCDPLDHLAAPTAPGGTYESRKSQSVLVGDARREAVGQRFVGITTARLWPFADIKELAFQGTQLKESWAVQKRYPRH